MSEPKLIADGLTMDQFERLKKEEIKAEIKAANNIEMGLQKAPLAPARPAGLRKHNSMNSSLMLMEDGSFREFEHVGAEIGLLIIPKEWEKEDMWRGAFTEMVAMIFFLFFTIGTVASTSRYSAANGFAGLDSGRQWMIASVFGFMITVLVYAVAPASGGNLNPAVSVALAFSKKISPVRCVVYIIAQCIGACIGCALVKAVSQDNYNAIGGAVNQVADHYTTGGAFLAEMMGTALLVFVVVSAVDANNGHPERVNMKQSHGVASIGLTVTMAHCVLIPITNCSINPARSFGASFVHNSWPDHWLFWVAPITGGIISTLVYELVVKDKPPSSSSKKS
jgi:aquaporin PIP